MLGLLLGHCENCGLILTGLQDSGLPEVIQRITAPLGVSFCEPLVARQSADEASSLLTVRRAAVRRRTGPDRGRGDPVSDPQTALGQNILVLSGTFSGLTGRAVFIFDHPTVFWKGEDQSSVLGESLLNQGGLLGHFYFLCNLPSVSDLWAH